MIVSFARVVVSAMLAFLTLGTRV